MLIFVLLITMFTATDLQKQCESGVPFERGLCLGYLGGFGEATMLATTVTTPFATAIITNTKANSTIVGTAAVVEDVVRLTGCPSDEVRVEQVRLVFLKYIENHPEQLHLPANYVFSKAMLAAFPCRNEKGEHR